MRGFILREWNPAEITTTFKYEELGEMLIYKSLTKQ